MEVVVNSGLTILRSCFDKTEIKIKGACPDGDWSNHNKVNLNFKVSIKLTMRSKRTPILGNHIHMKVERYA